MKTMISPSILGIDFGHLSDAVDIVNHSSADFIHLDVMDGVFVPNISFGFPVIKSISSISLKKLDTHLMIVNPERYIQKCKDSGCSMVSVHYEACTHLHSVLTQIKELGMTAGVVLNPHTPITGLEYSVEFADFVLLMSVNPGFGGQEFIPSTYRKIEELRRMTDRLGLKEFHIEIDGGVNEENASRLTNAGADILVAGNAVFNSDNPVDMIDRIKIAGTIR